MALIRILRQACADHIYRQNKCKEICIADLSRRMQDDTRCEYRFADLGIFEQMI